MNNGNPGSVLRLQHTLQTNAAYYTVWVNTEDEAKRFLEDLAKIPTNGGTAE